jgi:hypothetical protein
VLSFHWFKHHLRFLLFAFFLVSQRPVSFRELFFGVCSAFTLLLRYLQVQINEPLSIVGSWYPRQLQGRRYAVLYSSVSLTGAFGGLLATGIHALDGTHGIAGWRFVMAFSEDNSIANARCSAGFSSLKVLSRPDLGF